MMVTMVLMIMTEVVAMMSMLRRRKRKSNIEIHVHDVNNTKEDGENIYLVHNGDMAQHGRHFRH